MAWNDWLKKAGQTVGQAVNAAKDKVEEYAPAIQNTVQNVGNAVSSAVNTGKQVVDKVKEEAPGVINMVQKGVQEGINKAQDWVEDKVQPIANGVSQAIDFGKEMYNVGKAGYEGAVEGVKDYYSGDSETQAPQQDNTDWAAEYDKVMNETTAPTTPSTDSTTPTQNPDGSVTVTQPNGQPINTSPAASATLGEGAGQWQAELDGIMKQIMNREKFSYDMNGDAMYQQYADMYKNQANLGMQNAMGQAAALTGGYGSSYGQMVGQQAYAQQMQGLNDVALDLYDRAYNQYQDEGNQLAQQYAMIADREQQAYNRDYQANRDAVADEQWDQSFEYQKYLDELNQSNYEKEFEYQQGRDTINDARYDQEWKASEEQRLLDNDYRNDTLEEDQRQFNESMKTQSEEFNKMYGYTDEDGVYHQGYYDRARDDEQSFNKEMAKQDHDWQVEELNKMYGYTDDKGVYHKGYYETQSDKEYERMYGDLKYDKDGNLVGGGYQTKRDAIEDKRYDDEWKASEEQRKIENKWTQDSIDSANEAANPNTTYEGSGTLNGQSVPKVLAGVPGLTTTNTNLFDDNGNFKTAAVVTKDSYKGTMTYNIGGKEVTLKAGTNPYTNTVNPDTKNGVMDNGYQPDNIGGNKVTESEAEVRINGQWTPIYTTDDGIRWYYDAANNLYKEMPKKESGGGGGSGKAKFDPTIRV